MSKQNIAKRYVCALYFNVGYACMILPSVLHVVVKRLHLSQFQAGLLLGISSFLWSATSFAIGPLLDKRGYKSTGLIGNFLMIVGCFALFVPSSTWLWVGYLIMSAGIGSTMPSSGLVVKRYFSTNEVHSISNQMQIAFALGGVLAPVFTSILFNMLDIWNVGYLLVIIVAVINILSLMNLENYASTLEKRSISSGETLKELYFVALMVATGLYVALELGLSNWYTVFFTSVRSIDATRVGFLPSAFWIGLLAGRFLFPLFKKKINSQAERWLVFTTVLASISIFMLLILGINFLAAFLLIIFEGFTFSTIYPTIQGLMLKRYNVNAGRANGIFAAVSAMSVSVVNALVGNVADKFGIFNAFLMMSIFGLVLIVFAIILYKEGKSINYV